MKANSRPSFFKGPFFEPNVDPFFWDQWRVGSQVLLVALSWRPRGGPMFGDLFS